MSFVPQEVPVRVVNYSIDSRLRNRGMFPSPAKYWVDIPTPLRNVVKVELVSAMYEKVGDEKYVNLSIMELDRNLESNDNSALGVFAQLPMLHPLNQYTAQQHRSVKLFDRPVPQVGRLTLRFHAYDNTPYQMGEHFLRFEFHCCESGDFFGGDFGGSEAVGGLGFFSESVRGYSLPPPGPREMHEKTSLPFDGLDTGRAGEVWTVTADPGYGQSQ